MLNYGGFGLGLVFQAKDLATKTINQVERNLKSLSQSADEAGRRFAESMRLLKTGGAGLAAGGAIAAPLALAGRAAFRSAAQFKQITKTFEMFLGSAERATQHVEELQRFAETTPFEFLDLTQYSRQMQAYGFQVDQVIPMLTAVGDAAAAMQDPMAMERIIRALGQVQAKGRLVGQELLQLTETGLPIYDILQKQLGLTADQLSRIAEQGIPAQEAIEAIMTGLTERYGGMMVELAKTPEGILSNIRDVWDRLMRGVGFGFYDSMKDALSGVLGMFTSIDPQKVGQAIGQGFRDLLGVLVPVFKVLVGVTGAVARFVQARPKVASFIITLAGISAAVLILAGGFLVVAGALKALPLLLQKVGISANLSLGHLLWPVLLVTAAFYALRYAYEKNLGGFADFVNRLALLWRGVVALVSSTKFTPEGGWTGLLPEDLRNKLKESGLLDIAVDIWRFTVRVRNFFSGLAAGVSATFRVIEAVVAPIGHVIFGVFRVIGQVLEWLGIRFARAGDAAPIKQWELVGRVAGMILGPILALWGASKALAATRAVLRLSISGLERLHGAVAAVKNFGGALKLAGPQIWGFVRSLGTAIWQAAVFGAKLLWAGIRAAGSFIASLIRTGITALVSFVPQIAAATSAAWAFTAALLANPITWVIAAVIALGAAIYLLWRNWDRVVKFITGAWAKYKKVIIAILAPMPVTWIFAPLILMGRAIYNLVKNWGAVRTSMVGVWQRIVQGFRVGATAIGQFFHPLIVFFEGFWNALRRGPRGFFAWLVAIIRRIGSFFLLPFQLIGNAVRGTASSITGLLSRPLRWIQNAFAAVWGRIGLVVTRAVSVMTAPLRWFAGWFKALFTLGYIFFTGFWGALKLDPAGFMKWFAAITQQMGRLLLAPFLVLGRALAGIWTQFASALANIWQGIAGWLNGVAQAVWQWITLFPVQVWTGITQAFNSLISSLPTWLQQIAEFFLGLPAQAIQWGQNLIGGFVEGVKDALGNLGNIAKTAAASVKRFLGLQSPAEAGPLSTADKWAPRLAEMFAEGLRRGVPLVSAASVTLASALSTGIAAAEIPTVRVPVVAPITMTGLSATRADREQPVAPAPVIPAGQARQVPPLLVRPLVPHETVKARETPAAQKGPDVFHLVVELDGRVIYETWRRYDLEEKDRSAPW